jgi:hypothetical protein
VAAFNRRPLENRYKVLMLDGVVLARKARANALRRPALVAFTLKAAAALRLASAVVDGRAVCCDGDGVAIFDRLRSRACDDEAALYAFDLLEFPGEDWRARSVEERKAGLAKLLANALSSGLSMRLTGTPKNSSLIPSVRKSYARSEYTNSRRIKIRKIDCAMAFTARQR